MAPEDYAPAPAVAPVMANSGASLMMLKTLAGAGALLMLLAASLPWISINLGFVSGSLNYFQCWQLLQDSGVKANDQGAIVGALLLLPPLSFVALAGAALSIIRSYARQTAVVSTLAGGLIGVSAVVGLFLYLKSQSQSAFGFSFDPSSLLGPGFWFYGLVSAAAVGVGLWFLLSAQNSARGGV